LAFLKKFIEHILENIRTAIVIRIRKCAAGHALQTKVIPFPVLAPKAYSYIPQALQASCLRIEQNNKLLPATETLGVFITSVTVNTLFETMTRNKLQKLAEYCIPYHWANLRFFIGFVVDRFKSNKNRV
jgi:hypothetical protein